MDSGIKKAVYARLRDMGIPFRLVEHECAPTMDQCRQVSRQLGAMIPVNLFLSPRRHETYFLLLSHPDSRFHASHVSRQLASPRLSFAPEQALLSHLCARSGSASPMGFLFPQAADVTFVMDRRLLAEEELGFHPCENDATLAMRRKDFLQQFLPRVHKTPLWVDMEEYI